MDINEAATVTTHWNNGCMSYANDVPLDTLSIFSVNDR